MLAAGNQEAETPTRIASYQRIRNIQAQPGFDHLIWPAAGGEALHIDKRPSSMRHTVRQQDLGSRAN
jgi:predicted nicotinamide N-methyase